jgi:RNA polymerase sigma factor (sigma-70 family)
METSYHQERARLVRFCARYTGDFQAAEDLAQETLLAALRHRRELRDPAAYRSWLFGIARNQCLLWARGRGREVSTTDTAAGRNQVAGDAWPAETSDLDVELERDELARLLDRALALLPPETRAALIGRYIEDVPQAEVARRLGLSEGAVEARVHRGKLALRRILTGDLREDALSLGITLPETPAWQATLIWCPFCAKRRLLMHVDAGRHERSYRCPADCTPDGTIAASTLIGVASQGGTSPKAILRRALQALGEHYRAALTTGGARCSRCGASVPLLRWMPEDRLSTPGHAHGIQMRCRSCHTEDSASLWHLTLDTPAAQRFWRRHPRMRALPVVEVAAAGQQALLTGFESLDDASRLEIISARDSYAILHIHGDPGR